MKCRLPQELLNLVVVDVLVFPWRVDRSLECLAETHDD